MRKEDRKQKKSIYKKFGSCTTTEKCYTCTKKNSKKREHQQRASNKFHLLLMGVCLYARDYKCNAFREEKTTKKTQNLNTKKLYYKLQNFANGRLDAIKFISVCGIDALTFSA